MTTTFVQLNHGWNAEPNAPDEQVARVGTDLVLSFQINAFLYPEFEEGVVCSITFSNCWRYRLGSTNDEGWYAGKCRFSRIAPAWGEFYEVKGNLLLDLAPNDWVVTSQAAPQAASHHYLLYLRDSTFECDAESYRVQLPLQPYQAPRGRNEA